MRLVRAALGAERAVLYVEIHGNADPRTAQNIEVASKDITSAEAVLLKDAYPAALAAAQRVRPEYPALALLIEPADRVFWTASCVKTVGILARDFLPRALHFEFPRVVREAEMLDATAALTAVLLKQAPAR